MAEVESAVEDVIAHYAGVTKRASVKIEEFKVMEELKDGTIYYSEWDR